MRLEQVRRCLILGKKPLHSVEDRDIETLEAAHYLQALRFSGPPKKVCPCGVGGHAAANGSQRSAQALHNSLPVASPSHMFTPRPSSIPSGAHLLHSAPRQRPSLVLPRRRRPSTASSQSTAPPLTPSTPRFSITEDSASRALPKEFAFLPTASSSPILDAFAFASQAPFPHSSPGHPFVEAACFSLRSRARRI